MKYNDYIILIGTGIGSIGVFIGATYRDVNPIIPFGLFIGGILIMSSYKLSNYIHKQSLREVKE